MTPRQRFIAALERRTPDRLPVTTHHVMESFLKNHLGGITNDEFFAMFGLDPIQWITLLRPDPARGEFLDPDHVPGFLEPQRVVSDTWRITPEEIPGQEYPTVRYTFHTPRKNLTTVLQSNEHTSWVTERLVKEKSDVDVIADFATTPRLDVDAVNRFSASYGERGMVRGTMLCFDVYGQPGCWQDAAVLYGIEQLIMETYDDPAWVSHFLDVVFERKRIFVDSTKGAEYDLMEFGGGDASSTVISPQIFDRYVAPYDARIIQHAHEAGQRIVYHTCGGMMPFLERIAAMKPDAMETFTPPGMGGDARLAEAKKRIGNEVCMIGGFDQFHYFVGCTPEETRKAVRECFEAAGEGGGFILAPSDHFFEAEPELLRAFSDEAHRCVYD